MGDAAFVKLQQEPGKFNDGKPHEYAFGLTVRPYKGVPEVSHSGSTAGYRAHLTRFPEQQLSVAVLCNVSSGNATQYAMSVAEMYLGDAIKAMTTTPSNRPTTAAAAYKPLPADLTGYAGRFYSDEAEVVYEVSVDGDTVAVKRRPDTVVRLRPLARDEFDSPAGRLKFIRDTAGRVNEISLRGSRVFDLRFRRITGDPPVK